ncbi:MAG TPA: DUF3618 domain-containing protein [Gemmatimonadales bacterium]|nr:DUF3618 domain-containing protein [Gemmatimonadales bacterium]
MSEYERKDPGLAYEPARKDLESVESQSDKSPEDIEREIEQTRSRMSQNIDELGDRLKPESLKQDAKDAIRDVAQNAVSNVGEQARRTGSRLVDVIRENPLPVIAVGAGVTWLLTQRSSSDVSGHRMARYAYTGPERRQGEGKGVRGRVGGTISGVKDKVSEAASGLAERATELASGTQERVGDIGSEARRQTRRVKTNLEHAAEESPLLVAIGATVLGLALGLLLPGTERENELMGPARDQLMDRAERTAERVKDAAAEAGREVKEAVRTEINEHAPEVKQAVQDAGMTVKEQVKESAKKVKKEAKDAATEPGTSTNPRSTA